MILDELAAYARVRVEEARKRLPLEALKELVEEQGLVDCGGMFPFERAVAGEGISFICEVKRASPSKGMIARRFPYCKIANAYEAAGADCVSVLTEPRWFLGSDQIFREIRQEVSLPMLRKDFTVDEYQLYEARLLGANAVLLICALLDTRTIASYLECCDRLGLSALVEAHDEGEIASAVQAGARMIGVNNRNLKNFQVDFANAARLRENIPPDRLFVAESGVRTKEDVAALAALGADAVLMGEVLMRASDPREMLTQFRQAAEGTVSN